MDSFPFFCMCICVLVCTHIYPSKYPAQCWIYSVSYTLTMLTLLEHVTFFEHTFLRAFFFLPVLLLIFTNIWFLDNMYTVKQKCDFLKRENDWHYFRNLIAEIWIVQITIKMQNIMFNVRVTDYLFPQVYTIEYIMEFNQYKQAKSSPKYKWLRYDILK